MLTMVTMKLLLSAAIRKKALSSSPITKVNIEYTSFLFINYSMQVGMGQSQSVFEQDQYNQYAQCTYFNQKDILRLYKRFSKLDSGRINPRIADVSTRLTFAQMQSLPELRENPFKDRICQVFSTDGHGIHFEDFLDMFSVLSSHAPWELKAAYAFRIFDYNGDAAICKADIKQIVRNLAGEIVFIPNSYSMTSKVVFFLLIVILSTGQSQTAQKFAYNFIVYCEPIICVQFQKLRIPRVHILYNKYVCT